MNSKNWKNRIGRNRIYSKDFKERNDVILWDVVEIEKELLIKIVFISKFSSYRQGFRLAVDVGDGFLECNEVTAKEMVFWEDTAPKEFIVKCISPERLLSVYNVFQRSNFLESQTYGSGMVIEQTGNKTIYRCNDFDVENVDFNKLIFSTEFNMTK